MLGRFRRALIVVVTSLHRANLADIFSEQSAASADAVKRAVETLRSLPVPVPYIADDIDQWLPPRVVAALRAHGIRTLTELTLRIPRRRRWWSAIAGLSVAGARRVEAFFSTHSALTERARALNVTAPAGNVVPWEQLRVPHDVDDSHGQFRAPRATCLLSASNAYEAIQSWLALHESAATQRAYLKEAERLILWTIVERNRARSSLNTDDAIAYRTFLRRPTPRERWIGPSRSRHSVEWRPFTGALFLRSATYALNVLSALFRWLVEQRYILANPFAGVKVQTRAPRAGLDVSRGFSEGEWLLIRTIADGLECPMAGAHEPPSACGFCWTSAMRRARLPASWLVQRSPTSVGMRMAIVGCTCSASVASWRCRRLPGRYSTRISCSEVCPSRVCAGSRRRRSSQVLRRTVQALKARGSGAC